jgi:hypothetical protein
MEIEIGEDNKFLVPLADAKTGDSSFQSRNCHFLVSGSREKKAIEDRLQCF